MIKVYCLIMIIMTSKGMTSQQLCYYPTKEECMTVAVEIYDPRHTGVRCVPVYKDELTK